MNQSDLPPRVQGIYVELDVLLDTRLSTLFLVHESLVGKVLDTGYHSRWEDSFIDAHPALTKDQFKKLYESRDNEVLHNASFTKALHVLRDAVKKLQHQRMETPYSTAIRIEVNTYPYVLSNEEEAALARVLIHYTAGVSDLEFIRKSDEELTPQYCERNYSLMMRYHWGEWLDHHAKTGALKRTPLTHVVILVPQLFFAKLPTQEQEKLMLKGKLDPFKDVEVYVASVAGIKVMPVDIYSLDLESKWMPWVVQAAQTEQEAPKDA